MTINAFMLKQHQKILKNIKRKKFVKYVEQLKENASILIFVIKDKYLNHLKNLDLICQL